MNPTRRVVICGQSLFLMAIEAGLAGVPDIEVIRLGSADLEPAHRFGAFSHHLGARQR